MTDVELIPNNSSFIDKISFEEQLSKKGYFADKQLHFFMVIIIM